MTRIMITLSDEATSALHVSRERLGEEIRLAAAIKLFELGRLSSGAAGEIAGIPRALFLCKLGDYGVDTFRLTEEDLSIEKELA